MPTVTAPHVQSKSGQTGLTTVLPVNGRRPGIANEFVCDRMVMLLRAVLMSTTVRKGEREDKGGRETPGRKDAGRKGEIAKERRQRRRKREKEETTRSAPRRVADACVCSARNARVRRIVRAVP